MKSAKLSALAFVVALGYASGVGAQPSADVGAVAPPGASKQAEYRLCIGLNRIDTTLVSSRITLIGWV